VHTRVCTERSRLIGSSWSISGRRRDIAAVAAKESGHYPASTAAAGALSPERLHNAGLAARETRVRGVMYQKYPTRSASTGSGWAKAATVFQKKSKTSRNPWLPSWKVELSTFVFGSPGPSAVGTVKISSIIWGGGLTLILSRRSDSITADELVVSKNSRSGSACHTTLPSAVFTRTWVLSASRTFVTVLSRIVKLPPIPLALVKPLLAAIRA
jgi:hypothetical protein